MRGANKSGDGKSLSREQTVIVLSHLRLLLRSHAFVRSARAQDFLSLVVRNTIKGRYSNLHERMIGAELFGRSIDYDTGSDSVVRVTATEVRKRLNQFYLELSQDEWPVKFELPIGSYVPVFVFANVKLEQPVEPEPVGAPISEPLHQIAPPVEDKQPETLLAVSAEQTASSPKKGLYRLRVVATLLAIVVFSALVYLGWKRFNHPHPLIQSLVILPLKNLSGDPKEDFIADGLTAELINSLGQLPSLRVISLTSSMNLKGSRKMIPQIAREMGVQAVMEGTVQREGDRLRVNAQLIDGLKDRPIWAATYVRDVNSILNLQEEIATDISREISTSVAHQEKVRLARSHTFTPGAHQLYLRGLLLLNNEDDIDALSFLQRAVQADPKSAQAHVTLAECFGRLAVSGLKPNREAFSAQESEALQAISLDPSLAESHAELAEAIAALDWDWQTAGKEYQRALELNPNSVEIHQKYAIFLLFQGRANEAINQVEMGADLDPISAVTIRNEAFVYFFARKYDKVLSLIDTTHSMGVETPGSKFFLGAIAAGRGQYQVAIDWFQNAPKSPHILGHLGNAYALAGQKANALKTLAELQADVHNQDIGLYEIALVYAGLGDKKSAIQWLKKASDAHDIGLMYIKIDPCLDPLRNEPEFQDLAKRIGVL
jgi:TolB-like protein/Tfp pilus assembly protein PilF